MSATLTVTGKIGAGATLTAQTFTNVSNFSIDCVNNVIAILIGGSQPFKYVDINAATTVTATKSGATWTLTIS